MALNKVQRLRHARRTVEVSGEQIIYMPGGAVENSKTIFAIVERPSPEEIRSQSSTRVGLRIVADDDGGVALPLESDEATIVIDFGKAAQSVRVSSIDHSQSTTGMWKLNVRQ